MDPIAAMREARTAVVGRHARHLLSNCAPALNLDYHCIRRLHARIALTDSSGVQARLHPAVQRRLVLIVHRFRALSARRSRRACRQAPCVHSEADARARTHCPRGWFLAIIGRLGRVCGPCHRGEPRALQCTALRPFVDAVDCRGVQCLHAYGWGTGRPRMVNRDVEGWTDHRSLWDYCAMPKAHSVEAGERGLAHSGEAEEQRAAEGGSRPSIDADHLS